MLNMSIAQRVSVFAKLPATNIALSSKLFIVCLKFYMCFAKSNSGQNVVMSKLVIENI